MRREVLYQTYEKVSLQLTLTIAEEASNERIGENNACKLPTKSSSPIPKRRLVWYTERLSEQR